jgi:hypothetical protein
MKRILFLLVACIMITGFLSASDVLAVDLTKLPYSEWKITGLSTRYDAGAYNGSAVISQGMLTIGEPADGVIAVTNHGSDLLASLLGGLVEYYCAHQLGAYTLGVDKIKSTTCTMNCVDYLGNPGLTFSGPCDAKIIFGSGTQFDGTITIPDLWGAGNQGIFTIKGTKVGKYGVIASSTSLRDALRNSAPESLRNLFRK